MMETQEQQVALPLRSHTILGVCEAIGEDFGFNPLFLRIPLATVVIWSPTVAFGTYFALGAVILLSRLLFPNPKVARSAENSVEPVTTVAATPAPQVEEPQVFAKAA